MATEIHFTRHAKTRIAERGFSRAQVEFVLKHADVRVPTASGNVAVVLSHRYAEDLRVLGVPPLVLKNVCECCVVAHDTFVLTVHRGAETVRGA